jgi:hypothetical protein
MELGATAGLASPLLGATLGLIVIVVWINAERRDYSLSRVEWIITLAGQGASVLAVLSLFQQLGSIAFQAACAGYLSAYVLGLTPALVWGLRRTLRDPKSAATRTAQAADALLGRRTRH